MMNNGHKRTCRILYVVQPERPGGAEISTLLLLSRLDRRKFVPIVLVPPDSPLEKDFQRMGVKTVGFVLPRIKTSNPFSVPFRLGRFIKTCLQIRNIIKQHSVQIVHAVSNKRTAAYGIVSARLAKVRSIWTVRELQRDKAFDWLLLSGADKVIAVSNAVKACFKSNSIDGKMEMIYNAVDLDAFDSEMKSFGSFRAKWGLQEDKFIVAIASRLVPIKRHTLFLKAASYVLKQEPSIAFVVIGDPKFDKDQSYIQSLKSFCHDLGIKDSVQFVGFEKNIPRMMLSIDVLTLCCENEPFGRVVVEARAMGKPFFALNSPEQREIIVDGKSGVLVPPGDPIALAEAILELYKDDKLRHRIGEAGRQRIQNVFTVQRHLEAHERVYEQVMASNI
ncbi:glycosyltransferase family 1 protein [Candidatus Parcubacteria bacterium]|nr:MAG: glycosyltransferase family 1 protein [Candidatus Parcubacteria bacterium]